MDIQADTRSAATGGIQSSMIMDRNETNHDHFVGDFTMEDSPSYDILRKHKLLASRHRVANFEELDLTPPNSSRLRNTFYNCLPCFCCVSTAFEVPNGRIRPIYDGRGNYYFCGPGVHLLLDLYAQDSGENVDINKDKIVWGDRTICTVQQGYIGYCIERGQPVLLPPGMHQWSSPTLKLERSIDLNQPVIELGPWTLLTIDQGYMAVTQDNGKQVILDGGEVYLLTHRNWKFEKFVSTKIQTDELTRIEAASADNVIMLVDATVLWKIADVETAVRMSAETMDADGSRKSQTIAKLRNDVLKQAEASLAFFVGTINFSDSMAASANNARFKSSHALPPLAESQPFEGSTDLLSESGGAGPPVIEFNLYNNEKLDDAVSHANDITKTYGVEIISINIISAIPKSIELQASLAKGAVAAAEAQMMETSAEGKSRAMHIEAKAEAAQTMIRAKARADADILQAEGARKAADLLSENPVSVELAKIDRTGAALAGNGNNSSFFFGADARSIQAILSNDSLVGNSRDK